MLIIQLILAKCVRLVAIIVIHQLIVKAVDHNMHYNQMVHVQPDVLV